jgi:hypothetical protein
MLGALMGSVSTERVGEAYRVVRFVGANSYE